MYSTDRERSCGSGRAHISHVEAPRFNSASPGTRSQVGGGGRGVPSSFGTLAGGLLAPPQHADVGIIGGDIHHYIFASYFRVVPRSFAMS